MGNGLFEFLGNVARTVAPVAESAAWTLDPAGMSARSESEYRRGMLRQRRDEMAAEGRQEAAGAERERLKESAAFHAKMAADTSLSLEDRKTNARRAYQAYRQMGAPLPDLPGANDIGGKRAFRRQGRPGGMFDFVGPEKQPYELYQGDAGLVGVDPRNPAAQPIAVPVSKGLTKPTTGDGQDAAAKFLQDLITNASVPEGLKRQATALYSQRSNIPLSYPESEPPPTGLPLESETRTPTGTTRTYKRPEVKPAPTILLRNKTTGDLEIQPRVEGKTYPGYDPVRAMSVQNFIDARMSAKDLFAIARSIQPTNPDEYAVKGRIFQMATERLTQENESAGVSAAPKPVVAPKTEVSRVAAPAGSTARVTVEKDGQQFTVPADQLPEAIKQGYVSIPGK